MPSSVASHTVPVLGPGRARELNFGLSCPAGLPLGATYDVLLLVDPDNDVEEISEDPSIDGYLGSNNVVRDTIHVTRQPDALEPLGEGQGAIGLGVIRGTETWSDLNLDSHVDSDYYTFRLSAPGQAGDEIRVTFSHAGGDLTVFLGRGNQTVAKADSADDDEVISLEGMPAGQYSLCILGPGAPVDHYDLTIIATGAPGPNLVPAAVGLPAASAATGAALDVDATLWNLGDADAAAFAAQYVLSTDPDLDPPRQKE